MASRILLLVLSVQVTLLAFIGPITDAAGTETEDYYALLNVDRSAALVDIRRSFKKLAIKLHPDRVQGEKEKAEAQERFIRINRAYEVLKDDDLRKKYDQYGEEGLKDDHHSNQQYNQWNRWQQDAGLYDDDDDIITLDSMGYRSAVEDGNDVFIVDFYHTECSHCHDLADHWRQVARSLKGILKVGAVNCQHSWRLCNNINSFPLRSYPSIVVYRRGLRSRPLLYKGIKQADQIIDWALEFVPGSLRMSRYSVAEHIAAPTKPLIMMFCAYCEESLVDLRKLAGILYGQTDVGYVDCSSDPLLCSSDYMGKYSDGHDLSLRLLGVQDTPIPLDTSLSTADVATAVEALLPEEKPLDVERIENGPLSGVVPWLLLLHSGDDCNECAAVRTSWRRLASFMNDDELGFTVGRVDCSLLPEGYCESNFGTPILSPKIGMFRDGTVAHEFFHGDISETAEIIRFGEESSRGHVITVVSTEDLEERLSSSADTKEWWFVDFHAPWCAPCRRIASAWRRASTTLKDDVRFASVDCTVMQELCSSRGINAYPTMLLYSPGDTSDAEDYDFGGDFSDSSIVHFAKMVMQSHIQRLTPSTFQEDVMQSEDYWIVDFFSPKCQPCKSFAPVFRSVAADLDAVSRFGTVDCITYFQFCQEKNIRHYPTLRFYFKDKAQWPQTFRSHLQYDFVLQWAHNYLPSPVITLTQKNFEDVVLAESEPILVDFFAGGGWCGPCNHFQPVFRGIAEELQTMGVRAGKVDCDVQVQLCRTQQIREYPTLLLFPAGRYSSSKIIHNIWDTDVIKHFVKIHVGTTLSRKDEL